MKKIMAIALVAAMILSIVPASLATTNTVEEKAETVERRHRFDYESPLQQKAVNNDGTVVNVADYGADRTITTDDVNKKYMTVSEADFETKKEWQESPRAGIEMMDQEGSFLNGYWLDYSMFAITDTWYNDGRDAYTQIIQPIDSETNDYHEYMEGETVWFNYQVYAGSEVSNGEATLIPLQNDVSVGCYLYGGTHEDFSGEGGSGIRMVDAWLSGDSSVSVKVTAPEDNWVYMFVIVVDDTTISDFGAWISMSYCYAENDFKKIESGDSMTIGKPVKTNVKGEGSSLVLAPFQADYVLAYGAKHAVELEGGKRYVAMFDSVDSIGVHAFFCDENMDIINETWVGSGAIAAGASYRSYALAVMPAISGTYYIVTCGFYLGDAGEIEATLYNWNDVATPVTNTDSAINLDSFGTELVTGPETGNPSIPYAWYYWYWADANFGELSILWPGTYTIVGSNENLYCDIYDGVHVILKNATMGSTWITNSYAPVTIESQGNSTITSSMLEYTIYNYEGMNAGLYLLGDNLTIAAEGRTIGAIITESAPIHIGTKQLDVYAVKQEGYYPIALWLTGKNHPELTLADNAKFADGMKKSTMYYDGDGYFFFGYTVSEHEELYRLNNQPKIDAATLEFTLTTSGTFSDGGSIIDETLLGDANLDGKVNTGDATTVLKHSAMMIELTGQAFINADMNRDGNVNTGDATAILKKAAEG